MKGILTQCRFEVIRIFRNPYYVFWSLMMPIAFYFIYTNVFNTELPDQDEWQAHFLMSMTTFSVMGSAVMNFGIRMVQEHTQGWARFMKITPFPSWAYFSAKMFGQMIMHLLSIIVIFTVGSIINGIALTAGQWIAAGAWILIASIPFLALGSLIGTMKKVETASGVSNILYLGLAILGGMWMPMEAFPPLLQNIGEWLPSYYFGSGAWEIVLGNPPELLSIAMLIVYMVVFMYLAIFIRRKRQV
ncbi:ABC transporter permease [Virgibacillus dakarensis]|uniref:Transport permease YvfS n=1 Tax=Lentibacillus populi TaxID=1827502 RepID=A0A9W5X5S0_9BACI|nr:MULTISPECIES: ABC transporter permease [Bacillaceae]MBT2215667.1 ABC transporter permease [Virgibacillus dakarensis]MTW85718.1 ABC transporter permease [Virgibacillus dakarensis]GGB46088.1 putative transport permease YvfS [Lentibacillus populi]